MKQALITLLVILMMTLQTTCNSLIRSHESSSVVANLLTAPYIAVLLSVLCIFATLI